jgi:hypothetical protein
MSADWKNELYFGDNLDILKQLYEENPKGLIDLIYLDVDFLLIQKLCLTSLY